MQTFEPVPDRAVVGQGPAQPALVDIGHAAAAGFALDGFLRLALGADEEHEAALAGDLGEVTVGPQQAADGFTQIDNVDEIALAVDIRAHLRVPAAGPVAEVNAGFD